LSPTDPPSRPPGEPGDRGGPSVGNILGFSLLFRERKALLALQRRGLSPGVRLRDYEAEIPGVSFPLKGPLDASAFRNRRCVATRARISFEDRALRPWLEGRLVGLTVAGIHIDEVALDLNRRLPRRDAAQPCAVVSGRAADGSHVSLGIAFDMEAEGRVLRLQPAAFWLFGTVRVDARELWSALARKLVPEARADGLDLVVDPARLALVRPFVTAGWKAPDLARLDVADIELARRGISIAYASDPKTRPPAPNGVDDHDPIARALDRAREDLLSGGEAGPVLDVLEQATAALDDFPAARLACVRWRVDVARFADPDACIIALREWLSLAPNSTVARRILGAQLALAGRERELAQLLAADCRRAENPAEQARLELALATLLVEKLDDPRSALAIAGPLVARIRDTPALASLLAPALVALAQARVADATREGSRRAPHALAALDEALDLVDDPVERASMRARVARSLADRGGETLALQLLSRAIADDPADTEQLDLAVALSLRVGEPDAAVELLRLRLDRAPADETDELRRRLLAVLAELHAGEHRSLARRELALGLEAEPDAPDYLRMAADLERETGDLGATAEYLARLADALPSGEERTQVLLERSRTLRDGGQSDRAWEVLRELLDGELAPTDTATTRRDELLDVLELGLELAPSTARPRLLDRLIETASGERRAEALIERAAQAISVDDKLRDLWAAVEELDRPSTVLTQIAGLLADDDVEGLLELADIAAAHEDARSEVAARARAGRRLLGQGDHERAVVQLGRALELEPYRADLQHDVGVTLDALGRAKDALEYLLPLVDPDKIGETGADPIDLDVRCARLLSANGDDPTAAERLVHAERQIADDDPRADAIAEDLFSVQYRLGRTIEARDLARRAAERGPPASKPTWLVRAAQLSEPTTRLKLLRQAQRLDPDDREVAQALEAALRTSGERAELEMHLKGRLERTSETHERVSLLERLVACIGDDPEPDSRRAELLARYEEILSLVPEHLEARLAAGTLRRASGDEAGALEAWSTLPDAMPGDPRVFEPALALARSAIRREELPRARALVAHALDARPGDREALQLLRDVAAALSEPALALEAARGLLALASTASERAALELECAEACIESSDPVEAFKRFDRAATSAEARSALHLQVAERWLEVAVREGNSEQEAAARAQMRRALGSDLPVEDLLTEIRVLADDLGRAPEAFVLLELGLSEHDGDPRLLATLDRLARTPANQDKAAAVMRSVVEALEPGPGRDRVAGDLARLARSRDEAATTLFALDRLSADAGSDELFDLRDWAIRQLGRLDEELAEVETRLLESGPTPMLTARLLHALDGDRGAAAERTIEIAERAERDVAIALTRSALDGMGNLTLPELTGRGVRILIDAGDLDAGLWQRLESAVLQSDRPDRIAMLADLGRDAIAIDPSLVAGRLDVILDRALARFPADEGLHRALARWLGTDTDDATSSGETALVRRLADIAREHELHGEALASIWIAHATRLGPEAEAELLRDRAAELARDPSAREGLVARLRERGRWSQVADLLATDEARRGQPEPWITLAEEAFAAGDLQSEARARGEAGLLLFAQGETARAVPELERALHVDPSRPALQHALGRCLRTLGRPRDALTHLLPLAEGDDPQLHDVDLGDLAHTCGRSLVEVGDSERAVDMLSLARTRTRPGAPRLAVAEDLFASLVQLGRHGEARRLCIETADEIEGPPQLPWLERAAELSSGRERLSLLERASTIEPDAPRIMAGIEACLRDLDDRPALQEFLRRRVAADRSAGRTDAPAIETLLRLIGMLRDEAPGSRASEELVGLWRALLELAPGNVDALLALADHHRDQSQAREAIGLWKRAAELLEPEDPRFFEPAGFVARHAMQEGDLDLARTYFDRALAIRPADRTALTGLRELAERLGEPELALRAARGLLAHAETSVESARLEHEAARALESLGRDDEALVSLAHAAELVEVGSPEHLEVAESWLRIARKHDDSPDQRREEARARSQLRRALGAKLPTVDLLAEVSLLADRLDRLEPAIVLVEDALVRRPHDTRLLDRLRELCERSEASDRLMRALRKLVDALSMGSPRDRLARELAESARSLDAARTVLHAIERMSPAGSGQAAVLDLRDWAVRKLGRVDDELEALCKQLAQGPREPVLVSRMLRMLDGDARACAAKLLELVSTAPEDGRGWLARRALELLREHAPHEVPLLIDATRALIDANETPGPAWTELERLVLEADEAEGPARLIELIALAEEGENRGLSDLRGRADRLLDRALARHPDHAPLHTAMRKRLPGEGARIESALTHIESLARVAGLDDRTRARLLVGLADSLEPGEDVELLRRQALARIDEREAFNHLLTNLRSRGAWSAVADLLEARDRRDGVDAEAWLSLAEAASDDPATEARARLRAGRSQLDDGRPEALESLRRAAALAPDDAAAVDAYARALEASGEPAAALAQLLPFAAGGRHEALGTTAAQLATRCAELAVHANNPEQAAEMFGLALENLDAPRDKLDVAERLVPLLAELGRRDQARRLANTAAELATEPERQARWLATAARHSDDQARARLLEQAFHLVPEDAALATELEDALRKLDDTRGLEALLRWRLQAASGVGVGDPATTLAVAQRLLELVDDTRIDERAELLEFILQVQPDHEPSRMELAEIRHTSGDEDAAVAHWRRLGELLPDDDPRMLEPARALARVAFERRELEEAQRWLSRALGIEPRDTPTLELALDVAGRLDDLDRVLACANTLLEASDRTRSTAELHARLAAVHQRRGDIVAAVHALERAAHAVERGSDLHETIAQRWLRAATSGELEEPVASEQEASARACLRDAMGDRLPANLLMAEATVLSRIGRHARALELLAGGLRDAPNDETIAAGLEGLAARTDLRGRVVGELDSILSDLPPSPARVRLAERLARVAREQEDAATTLRAVDAIGDMREASSEALSLREWAVRKLNRVTGELGTLDEQLLERPDDKLVTRMLRMLDDDGEACADRLLELCARATPDVARQLAPRALDVARAHASDRLDVAMRCLAATARYAGYEPVAAAWPSIEQLVLAEGDADAMARLLQLALDGAERQLRGFDANAARLIAQGMRRAPEHVGIQDALWREVRARGGDAEISYLGEIDRLVAELESSGSSLAQAYGGVVRHLDPERAAVALRDRARRHANDRASFDAFCELLAQAGAWSTIVELSIDAGIEEPEHFSTLAVRAAETSRPAEAAARDEAGRLLLAAGDLEPAVAQLERAIELAPTPALWMRLGQALERMERPARALEHYLKVFEAGDEGDPVELALTCAKLATEAGDRRQAATVLVRARDRVSDPETRLALAERAYGSFEALGAMDEATALARECVDEAEGDDRATWLLRASEHSESGERLDMLRTARKLRPDDEEIADDLEDALAAAGVRDELEKLLRERLERAVARVEDDDSPRNVDVAVDIVHRLLPLLERESDRYADVTELYRTILSLEPDNVPALLALADLCLEHGDEDEAIEHWIRAGELLPHDDDTFFEPGCQLAQLLLERTDHEHARVVIERVLDIRPGDHEALSLLRNVAGALDDPHARLRAAQGLLAHGDDDNAPLELDLARAQAALGEREAALAAIERAAAWAPPGSELHREISQVWLDLATEGDPEERDASDWEREAAAREQRRLALGDELPPGEVRAEAMALVRLERGEEGLELLERRLAADADDELLLSALKDLCVATDTRDRYLGALERAVDATEDDQRRDRLVTELAYTAVELEDARKLLDVLSRVSGARANDPELLDLREWAVRKLGLVQDELSTLDQELLAHPRDEGIRQRMLRMLDEDVEACIRRFQQLSRGADPETAAGLAEGALALADSASPDDLDVLLGIAHHLTQRAQTAPIAAAWPVLCDLALASNDVDAIAALVHLGLEAIESPEDPLAAQVDELLEQGIVRWQPAKPLLQLLWKRSEASTTEGSLATASQRIRAIAERHGVSGRPLADLWSGLSDLLERRDAAYLLTERAQELADTDPSAFNGLVEALEARNHWPQAIALLEARVESIEDNDGKVELLKHLSHICADILADGAAAIRHLQRALELAPEDPDLLLPLLDHHYQRSELDKVIELSIRVMEHVPMGDTAFVALGHRAADAALAHGDHRFAESLLRRVIRRCPDDYKTRSRLEELEALADDPDHRCRMLQVIADRQAGSARVEALEERARLLVDPLGRVDEAISDLELVLTEAPERRDSQRLLERLYQQRERWADLGHLLENSFARQAGVTRSRTLRRLAAIYRDHLLDLSRADQTLRLALETLGDDPEARTLGDEIQLELVEVLEKEGRYAEIVSHLRRELSDELSDELSADSASQRRVELLGHLARILRDYMDDEIEAAKIYERLETVGRLPEDGLATLARGYRNQHRHADLVRVLIARSEALAEAGDFERKAEIDHRIGDLLEGPLRRPHEAARFYLDAYLANPMENTISGQRARVLLAGTDSVVNVRKLLLERIQHTEEIYYPLALTLLADLLAPHEEHEEEAETRYRMALKIDSDLAPALEGLGRLLAREGRLAEAVEPLMRAARSSDLDPDRAADDAATAARALQELGRPDEAEAILRHSLGRAPDAQRCLLELARLYGRLGRKDDEAHVLDELSALGLSSMLRAEVAFRRAMLLEDEFRHEPFSEAGELARTYLLEAVGSDAMHAQARQVLLDLATSRSEWSIVAHMLFLTIRELTPGAHRALTHLDLAEVYLDRLQDRESALRNLASALKQPTNDAVVSRRAAAIAERLPDPESAAERLEHAAENDVEIEEGAKGRLYLTAAALHKRAGNAEAAERASRVVMSLESASEGDAASARQNIDTLSEGDADLQREREALLSLLDAEDHALERLHILGRLREIGRALSDEGLAERIAKAQLELAHELLESDQDRDEAAAALLELFADRGEYEKIVELYESLADRTDDPARAAKMLTDAARFAWTGQRDAALAIAIVRRALVRNPGDVDAGVLMGEIATASDEPAADEALYEELRRLDPTTRSPALSLRLASAALRLGHDEEGRRLVFALLQSSLPPTLRLQALGLLDDILSRAGLTRDRIPVLDEQLRLTRAHQPDRASDVALELASVQTKLGALEAARSTCLEALQSSPSHAGLTLLYAELLERAEDWVGLARVLEQLAGITSESAAQAKWLTRAARVHLEHPVSGGQAMAAARRLLLRACEASPDSPEPRTVLLPLAFAEQAWDEVLELTVQLRAIAGDDDETLLFGALTEALLNGSRAVARSIGPRHHPIVRNRVLWPAFARVLQMIATEGPLPRLDAVIGAAAALCGGTEELHGQLVAWAAGQPPRAGISLALARLDEALGQPTLARHRYQIAAFLAPHGPVPGLAERLPEVDLPADPLRDPSWVPREYRGALREILIHLRNYMAGLRGQGGTVAAPSNAIERAALNAAARPSTRWRDRLGFMIPLRFTHDELPGGCGVRNEAEPTVVLNEEFASAPTPERNYRLAEATANIVMGTAVLTDTHPLPLAGLIDALAQLANPNHVPRSRGAQTIADTLTARGLRAAQVPPELRTALASELEHWLTQPGALAQLSVIIKRAAMLMAVRLSGHLDGALLAMARERQMLTEDDVLDGRPVLETEDAQWLLRTLGVVGGERPR
jgi:tetratricopeptide (TPR) repeat protein